MIFSSIYDLVVGVNKILNIQVNGINIERVNEYKVLGVMIDNLLSWRPHVNKLQSVRTMESAENIESKVSPDNILSTSSATSSILCRSVGTHV